MITSILAIILTLSFSPASSVAMDIEKDIIGVWVYSNYENEAVQYEKADAFVEDRPGIAFKADGSLVKRQNIGWCGTPPITYGNDAGTWTKRSDSTITIKYTYWGGTMEEDWQIVSLEDGKLATRRIASRKDNKK